MMYGHQLNIIISRRTLPSSVTHYLEESVVGSGNAAGRAGLQHDDWIADGHFPAFPLFFTGEGYQGCTKTNYSAHLRTPHPTRPHPTRPPGGLKTLFFFQSTFSFLCLSLSVRAYNQCTLPPKHVLNTYSLETPAYCCGLLGFIRWPWLEMIPKSRSSPATVNLRQMF